jgi:hypothetical protein
VLAMLNPPPAASRRFSGMEARQIREAIDTAIKRVEGGTDLEWVRRHFIHHKRASYLVIPNLYSCNQDDKVEASKALAMNQLAGVLADMGQVRWPEKGRKLGPIPLGKSELQKLKHEEGLESDTDLTEVRKGWLAKIGKTDGGAESEKDDLIRKTTPIRNHGLFSKAERALSIAGWSEQARRDIEIFPIVDVEGLTPLLMVLNETAPPESSKVNTTKPVG